VTSLLRRLQVAAPVLTTRERKIAEALETGYPHTGLQSATALAERVGVSAATVVRFAVKLGYDGYLDLQRELREEVEARLATPLQRLEQSAQSAAQLPVAQDISSKTFEVALAALTRSFGALDRTVLYVVAQTLTQCRGRIWIMGEKKARSIALYLFAQLNLCLPRVALIGTEAGFEGDQLLDANNDDILIAIDVRRYVRRVVLAADWVQKRGATLIVLSDSQASPLYQKTRLGLTASTHSAGAFDSYVGLMLLADIITNLTVARNPVLARKRLEEGEAAWASLGTFMAETATPKT
jgi:DNA-binding MurR/RpiR family transcriptional regulator